MMIGEGAGSPPGDSDDPFTELFSKLAVLAEAVDWVACSLKLDVALWCGWAGGSDDATEWSIPVGEDGGDGKVVDLSFKVGLARIDTTDGVDVAKDDDEDDEVVV